MKYNNITYKHQDEPDLFSSSRVQCAPRLYCRYDWFADFFGRQQTEQDGIGLSFNYHKDVPLGMRLKLHVLSTMVYSADVVFTQRNQTDYLIGIWVYIYSGDPLISLFNSDEPSKRLGNIARNNSYLDIFLQ